MLQQTRNIRRRLRQRPTEDIRRFERDISTDSCVTVKEDMRFTLNQIIPKCQWTFSLCIDNKGALWIQARPGAEETFGSVLGPYFGGGLILDIAYIFASSGKCEDGKIDDGCALDVWLSFGECDEIGSFGIPDLVQRRSTRVLQ